MATTATATVTVDDIFNFAIGLEPEIKRSLAIHLLQEFDGNAVLDILRQLPAPGPDYEDAGPITDEEITFIAAQGFLRLDEEEAALAQT